tara:strand:+ start:342 stop:491 length:150 start_codon:yes stop_codon:yes gene_type:complete
MVIYPRGKGLFSDVYKDRINPRKLKMIIKGSKSMNSFLPVRKYKYEFIV